MRRSWCRSLVSPDVAAALLFVSALSCVTWAQASAPDASAQVLYLEARVNQVPAQGLVRLTISGGQVWADRQAMHDLGLNPDGLPAGLGQQEQIRLDLLPDVQVHYDAPHQRVSVLAPVHLLERSTTHTTGLQQKTSLPLVDTASSGLLLNYDLYLQRSARSGGASTHLNAWTEWRHFQPLGVFSHTMLSQWSQRASGPGAGSSHLRLDTSWRSDFADKGLSLVLGDTVSSALSWSRPVRLGGLRLGTDFGLQPYRSTSPLTRYEGQAVLPSTVDLYVDGLLKEQLQVLPGAFTIESLTTVNGAGMAQLVITDATGQRRTLDVPIYGTVELLREGLVEGSFEVGAMRQAYGRESFSYASGAVASGSWRYGWSDAFTVEGQAQWGQGVRLIGFGGVGRLGAQGGVLNASLAASDAAGGPTGQQASAGFQWQARPWRFSVRSQRASPHFRDLALVGGTPSPRSSDRAFFGFSQSGWDIGATAMRQREMHGQALRLASVALTRQHTGGLRWTVGLSETRSTRKDARLSFLLSVPLDQGVTLSASAQRHDGQLSGGWQASRSALQEGDWSWRIAQNGPKGSAHLNLNQTTPYGQWAGSVDRYNGGGTVGSTTSFSTSFGGAVALMDRRAFLTRRIDDAFALVSTHGLEGIPVKLENRPIGRTDSNGHLLVNRLNANQRNQISVDLLDLAYDVSAAPTTLHAVPQRYSGVRVDFAFRRVVSARVALRDALGRPIPMGSTVVVESTHRATPVQEPAMTLFPHVGYDGEILIENPAPETVLRVDLPGGASCRVRLPETAPDPSGQIHLGEMACR
jgi:outer membrane usher protein